MPEEGNEDTQTSLEGGPSPELDARQLDRLADLVYRLMKEELLVNRERRGESANRAWR
jgi:hypothetical protein